MIFNVTCVTVPLGKASSMSYDSLYLTVIWYTTYFQI